MMERLTGKYLGRTGLVDNLNVQCPKICNQSFCESCPIQKAFDKLAHYEDLEEQGLLLKLPCKVGDTVYEIVEEWDLKSNSKYYVIDKTKFNLDLLDWFGKCVFLTKEEAERKLKEMQNE